MDSEAYFAKYVFEDGIPTFCPNWKDTFFQRVNAGEDGLTVFQELAQDYFTEFRAVEALRRGLACYATTKRENAAITDILNYTCDYSIFPKGCYSMEQIPDHAFTWKKKKRKECIVASSLKSW